jgi:hypothetical protein
MINIMSMKGFNLVCYSCDDSMLRPTNSQGRCCPDTPFWVCTECGFTKVSDAAALVERQSALRGVKQRPYDEQVNILLKETKPLGTKEYKWDITE